MPYGIGMSLGELIARLEKEDPNRILLEGFNNPRSYRGFYEDLAFEPCENVSIGEMLACAKEALGKTFQGYKGGDFTMNEYTDVWIAEWGNFGESIGSRLFEYILE